MGSVDEPKFPILAEIPSEVELSLYPPFTVSLPNGFLPLSPPPTNLPPAFEELDALLKRTPIRTLSGEKGLLATYTLGDAVLKLTDLTDKVDEVKHDLRIMGALYRDYCFLASAYLLEPCHQRFVEDNGKSGYGEARRVLPKAVARPLVKVAEIAGFKPFMEYAGSYALFNWCLDQPDMGMENDNICLIRAFEHGLDPKSSEAGFILTHVNMVKHSAQLVQGAFAALEASRDQKGFRFIATLDEDELEDPEPFCAQAAKDAFEDGLQDVVKALIKVNNAMERMWHKSKPGDYTNFRTFIFGITSQTMFPNGVIYEGVSEEPRYFRGESGANDSMIPLCDNLFEISMPEGPHTEIYNDFRSYRPANHRLFLDWVKRRTKQLGVWQWIKLETQLAFVYLHGINQVRAFRWRHWCFCKEYILKHTDYGTATGGSPIIEWLPNQLYGTYARMEEVARAPGVLELCEDMMELMFRQRDRLRKDVEMLKAEREPRSKPKMAEGDSMEQ